MSTDSDSRSWFVRFCDTFFQEQNIKYMLGVGMLILLGSSLMLVTSYWESYTPAWKYLILIAYTAVIHVGGQVAYHSLGLRKTGTGLMSLTVLLLPLSFLAVRWIDPHEVFSLAGLTHHAALAALLGVNIVFTALAARRIFEHFLRRTQPTFLLSYLTLCLAGAVLVLIPDGFAPLTALGLWCVFAAGSIKVNRHVFWLTEERRLPRICGFFPILLLGGLFLTLFSFNLAAHVPLTWIGFGCVLVAIPVLLAADAVADVFQKRGYLGALSIESISEGGQAEACTPTGLPWSVAIPLWIGLALTATGVCLSAAGFPQTYGLTPTAVLAATMLALTARRTGRTAFVWTMLIGVIIAYQASPVFFREFARTVVHQGAAAVHESKLPYAFYGLTYLPLLAGTALIAVWRERRRDLLFARPLRQFTVGLSLLLLAVSLTHVKAIFPAGAALTFGFLAQTLLFRDRRLMIPVAIAWTTTTLGSAPFVEQVLAVPVTHAETLLLWTGSATALFVLGRWLDPLTRRYSADEADWTRGATPMQLAGFGLLLVPVVGWLSVGVLSPGGTAPWLPAGAIAGMLLVHAVRWQRPGVVDLSLIFPVVAAALMARSHGSGITQVAGLVTVLLSLLWTCGCFLASARASQLRAAFRGAATRVSTAGLGLLLIGYLLPLCGLWILSTDANPKLFRIPSGLTTWIPIGLIVLWSFDAARRQWAGWIVPGWIAGMAFSGAVAMEQGATLSWLPVVWAALTLLAVPKVGQHRRIDADDAGVAVAGPQGSYGTVSRLLSYCTFFTFSLIALSSLLFFSTAFRVAGVVSLCGLLCLAAMLQQRLLRTLALMLVNWQVLCVVVQVFQPKVSSLFSLDWESFHVCALPVALVAGLQALVWERTRQRMGAPTQETRFFQKTGFLPQDDTGLLFDLINFHSILLQLMAGFSLLVTLPASGEGLAVDQAGLAILAFGALAALRITDAFRTIAGGEQLRLTAPADSAEFRRIREGAEMHVWCAIALIAAGTGYLWLFGVFTFNGSVCLFALLAAAVVASLISSWSLQSPRTAILAGPLRKTALWLPVFTVFIGVTRHFVYPGTEWRGLNSLALLLAAGFYFWRGLEQKQKSFIVLSAAIVNVALALLWHELKWSDPQFFMIPLGATLLALVELLKPEIPKSAHDPLRYVGALTILVSPTFHIVGGSWLHLLSLMVASVVITLMAMGLRVRALMYMGTGFLVADIIAMVVRGSIDRPSVLWIAGILVGASVITLAAWCERHREQLLQRLRLLSAELQTWE